MEKKTKKFLIEVEEGITECSSKCPLMQHGQCVDVNERVENVIHFLKCRRYNLATMKITEYEDKD